MLLNGVNHVAILTHDTDRIVAFYREVFDAEISSHLEEFEAPSSSPSSASARPPS